MNTAVSSALVAHQVALVHDAVTPLNQRVELGSDWFNVRDGIGCLQLASDSSGADQFKSLLDFTPALECPKVQRLLKGNAELISRARRLSGPRCPLPVLSHAHRQRCRNGQFLLRRTKGLRAKA